ncbi:MAG: hypothetical protein QW291_07025 [Thermofilaceae archaeon]
MPIYVIVGDGEFTDKVSTIFFPRDFRYLLGLLRKKFDVSYPTIEKLFNGELVKPVELLEEALDLLMLLRTRSAELPKAYFFAVLPKDFTDVVSLIGGGATSMTIPAGSKVYELTGGFGAATIKEDGEEERHLEAGKELTISSVKIKVFTRTAYEATASPLKTLIVASLIASKLGKTVKVTGVQEETFQST